MEKISKKIIYTIIYASFTILITGCPGGGGSSTPAYHSNWEYPQEPPQTKSNYYDSYKEQQEQYIKEEAAKQQEEQRKKEEAARQREQKQEEQRKKDEEARQQQEEQRKRYEQFKKAEEEKQTPEEKENKPDFSFSFDSDKTKMINPPIRVCTNKDSCAPDDKISSTQPTTDFFLVNHANRDITINKIVFERSNNKILLSGLSSSNTQEYVLSAKKNNLELSFLPFSIEVNKYKNNETFKNKLTITYSYIDSIDSEEKTITKTEEFTIKILPKYSCNNFKDGTNSREDLLDAIDAYILEKEEVTAESCRDKLFEAIGKHDKMANYFAILGIFENRDNQTCRSIRTAYHKTVLAIHPDHRKDEKSLTAFERVCTACNKLMKILKCRSRAKT
jgi:hypothetical protein